MTPVCKDGVCYLVDTATNAVPTVVEEGIRLAQGLMEPDSFISFLNASNSSFFDAAQGGLSPLFGGLSPTEWSWAVLPLAFLGGLAMNLTPCVLPMIPVNLLIVGKSARRGLLYGLGIALAYGILGVLAAVGGLAFGTLQAHPLFNLGVAVVFVFLSFSLFGAINFDLSRFRPGPVPRFRPGSVPRNAGSVPIWMGELYPVVMGALSAVLAGACVAPVLVSVLLLTSRLYAGGQTLALGLPFVVGLGMASPWPLLGAGFKVLPKPGSWMPWVNRIFAVFLLGLAAYYGSRAGRGCMPQRAGDCPPYQSRSVRNGEESSSFGLKMTPKTFSLEGLKRPVLVDCWASWCKNCSAMEAVLDQPEVKEALKRFTVIRMQCEDMTELKDLPGFKSIIGLPAFVIFE